MTLQWRENQESRYSKVTERSAWRMDHKNFYECLSVDEIEEKATYNESPENEIFEK